MNSVIQNAIIFILEDSEGEIKGSENLALALNTPKWWAIHCAQVVQSNGQLRIVPSRGGRGHKTIYQCNTTRCDKCPRTCRRNPNQPGLARKVKR